MNKKNIVIIIVSVLLLTCLFAFARTTTTDLGLVQPTWDESVDILNDLNFNSDILEAFANDVLAYDPSPVLRGNLDIATFDIEGVDATEFGYLDGVTSVIQTQLNLKAPLASPTFTGTVTIPTPFTLGAVSVLPTGTELNFVDGVTSAIQTQLNAKAATLSGTINEIAYFNSASTISSLAVATYPSLTELSYVKGVTSAIQTQLGLRYLKTEIDTETEMETIWGVGLAHSGANSDITSMTGLTTALGLAYGGTGQTTAVNAFDALSPITTLGDLIYGNATVDNVRLAGNVTTTKKYLTQTGTGTISAAPAWDIIATGDLPSVIDAVKIADGSVTSTEFQYINTLSSNAQTQLDGKQSSLPMVDTTGIVKGSVDATKIVRLEVDGLTTGTTRVLTTPDKDLTLVGTVDKLSAFAATTSAELAGVISDETGTGALVFGTSPTLTTPTISGDVSISKEDYLFFNITAATSAYAYGAPFINYKRSRGTLASPQETQTGDYIGSFNFYGMDTGDAYNSQPGAEFGAVQESSPTATTAPLYFKISTGNGEEIPIERMKVLSGGNIGIGVDTPTATVHLKAGSATDSTSPLKFTSGTLLTAPELGAMEFVDNGTDGYLYITLNIAGTLTRVQIAP